MSAYLVLLWMLCFVSTNTGIDHLSVLPGILTMVGTPLFLMYLVIDTLIGITCFLTGFSPGPLLYMGRIIKDWPTGAYLCLLLFKLGYLSCDTHGTTSITLSLDLFPMLC